MKSVLLIIGSLVLGAVLAGLVLEHRHAGEPAPSESANGQESSVTRTNGESLVKLDKAIQERIGLKVAPVEAVMLKPSVEGYGRVLDPAPLAALVADIAGTQAALEASTREFERLNLLHAQDQNVSTRALESAEATAKRDRVLAEAARLKLVADWGPAIADRSDLWEFVHMLVAQEAALLRIDLPAGETLSNPPSKARLELLGNRTNAIVAEFFSNVTSVDGRTQGQGFLFLHKGRSPGLVPGAAVIGYLESEGEAVPGVVIPREAVIRHEGLIWAYVQTADETFTRKAIAVDRPVQEGWALRAGLKADEKVVVAGAQVLMSMESGGGPPAD